MLEFKAHVHLAWNSLTGFSMEAVCLQFIGVANFGRDVFIVQYYFGVSMDVMCSQVIDQRSWTWCVHSSNILEIIWRGVFL